MKAQGLESTKSLEPSLSFSAQNQCALSKTGFSLSTSAHSHSCVLGKHCSNITMTHIYNNMELKTKLKEGEGEEHEKNMFWHSTKDF